MDIHGLRAFLSTLPEIERSNLSWERCWLSDQDEGYPLYDDMFETGIRAGRLNGGTPFGITKDFVNGRRNMAHRCGTFHDCDWPHTHTLSLSLVYPALLELTCFVYSTAQYVPILRSFHCWTSF
ncbi:uncharacterized protein BDV14DRAFT_152080 [Aspergillus stella-maris]|uniref:uncharacterized protein n=1 Tax=Aspergillus stella-maris TaxID=1810926 RepID=UPI003CCCA483